MDNEHKNDVKIVFKSKGKKNLRQRKKSSDSESDDDNLGDNVL